MHAHYHLHLHKIHLLKNELSEVYANLVIQSFAISLIAIFIPIYLMSIGFTFTNMLFFFVIFYGSIALFSPTSALLANRYGFKHIILFRTPLLIAFLLGLYKLESFAISTYLLAVVGGIAAALYWTSINSIFVEHTDKIHRGKQTGNYFSMPQIAALVGPTLGGIISLVYGFSILFLITTALVFLSVIPLFLTRATKPHINFNFKKMLKIKNNLKFGFYLLLDGPKTVASALLWPIFIYWGLSNNTTSTGFAQTLVGVGIIAFTYYIGKKSDKQDKFLFIKQGAVLLGILWFARIFATTQMEFYAYSLLAGLFTVLIDVPFTAAGFDQARKENPDEFVVFREISLNIGRALFLITIIAFSNATLSITGGFAIAGITTLMFLFFKENKFN